MKGIGFGPGTFRRLKNWNGLYAQLKRKRSTHVYVCVASCLGAFRTHWSHYRVNEGNGNDY